MASSKVISRLSPRLAFRTNKITSSPELSFLKSSSPSHVSVATTRLSRSTRLALPLSSVGSMMPLHSAIASARLTSCLSTVSEGWTLVPQGISMPL